MRDRKVVLPLWWGNTTCTIRMESLRRNGLLLAGCEHPTGVSTTKAAVGTLWAMVTTGRIIFAIEFKLLKVLKAL